MYQKKYLKYKEKYNNLKLNGGLNQISCDIPKQNSIKTFNDPESDKYSIFECKNKDRLLNSQNAKIVSLEIKAKQLNKLIKEMQEKNSKYESDSSSHLKNIKDLEQQGDEFIKIINNLKEKLQNEKTSYDNNMQVVNDKNKQNIIQNEKIINELKNNISKLNKEVKNKEQSIVNLKSQLQSQMIAHKNEINNTIKDIKNYNNLKLEDVDSKKVTSTTAIAEELPESSFEKTNLSVEEKNLSVPNETWTEWSKKKNFEIKAGNVEEKKIGVNSNKHSEIEIEFSPSTTDIVFGVEFYRKAKKGVKAKDLKNKKADKIFRDVNDKEKLLKRDEPYNFKFKVEETGTFHIKFSNSHSTWSSNSIDNYTFRKKEINEQKGGFLNKYIKYKKKYKILKNKLNDYL